VKKSENKEKNEEREGKMNLLREFVTAFGKGKDSRCVRQWDPQNRLQKGQITSSLSYFGQKLVLIFGFF
jgi:hypothetical protein